MVARQHTPDDDTLDPYDPSLDPDRYKGVHFVTTIEEARETVDARARYKLGNSDEEVLRCRDAGM